jgi:hypothetical protein
MRFRVALVVLLAAGHARAEDRVEANGAPIVGGDSDVGFGGGAFAALTKTASDVKPKYSWRLEASFLATFKLPSGGAPFRVPYQDYWMQLSLPHLLGDRMRLDVRPSYTRETTQRWYGFGNASKDTSPDGPDDPNAPFYQYGRSHPTLLVRARLRVGKRDDGFFVILGNSLTWNEIVVAADSKLAHDGVAGPPKHVVDFFEYGLELDRRDDDIITTRGTWDQIKLRVSPGGTESLPYRYAQVDTIVRGYLPLGSRIVLAARAVFDVQIGDPPFYEQARYEDTFALGGVTGVRGVPGQRYYGKLKLFGNLETRVRFVDFRAFAMPLTFGGAVFFDGGRVWTELGKSHPELDGTGLGIKYGIGGGLRLMQGTTFVVRGDIAWSPDAHPVGVYFTAGEAF